MPRTPKPRSALIAWQADTAEREVQLESERDAALTLADATQDALNAERLAHLATSRERDEVVRLLKEHVDVCEAVVGASERHRAALTASQAREAELREVFGVLLGHGHNLKAFAGTMLRCHAAIAAALALPRDTSALEAYGRRVREKLLAYIAARIGPPAREVLRLGEQCDLGSILREEKP